MSKKGLFSTLIISVVVTLALGVYTLVSLFMPANPGAPAEINLAMRSDKIVSVLQGYGKDDKNVSFSKSGEANPIGFDESKNAYVTKPVDGEVDVTVKSKKGSTVYHISVYRHNAAGISEAERFVISNAEELQEFAAVMNDTNNQSKPKFAKLVSDVDLEGKNWTPIGNEGNEVVVKGLTFDGANHVVKNMTMNVNSSNYVDYLAVGNINGVEGAAYLNLGFFGRIATNSLVKDLKLENAKINISSEVYDAIIRGVEDENGPYKKFQTVNVGLIAARASLSRIENCTVSGSIKGFSYAAQNNIAQGMGGVVGYMEYVQVTGTDVKLSVENPVIVSEEHQVGSNIGGIVGIAIATGNSSQVQDNPALYLAYKNTIDSCSVELSFKGLYSNYAYVGGLAAFGYAIDIKDSSVNSFTANDLTASSQIDYTRPNPTFVAGAITYVDNVKFENVSDDTFASKMAVTIQNVSVNNMNVVMKGASLSGFVTTAGHSTRVDETPVKIIDCSSNAKLTGRAVFGFVHTLNQNAEIIYSDNFSKNAVDVTLVSSLSAGFANHVYGKILGGANKTNIVVNAPSEGARLTADTSTEAGAIYVKNARARNFAAGFAADIMRAEGSEFIPEVRNFNIKFTSSNALSLVGVVYKMANAVIDNIQVDSQVKSYSFIDNEKSYSTTYIVSGAVGIAEAGSDIENVKVNIRANEGVNQQETYGATMFGGVVARITGLNVKVNGCTASGYAFFNGSNETLSFVNAVDGTTTTENIFLAGGLVGSVSGMGEGSFDALSKLTFKTEDSERITLTNNAVSEMQIVCKLIVKKENGSYTMGSQGYRSRAIGALVGNFNVEVIESKPLDLTTNSVTNVKITANKDTFSYAYPIDDNSSKTFSTLGLGLNSIEQNVVKFSYGISYLINSGSLPYITDVTDLASVTFSAL